MFHYDRGLFLTRPQLAIDVTRRQPNAFISHAHSDHMARHHFAFCTPETAALYHWRYGPRDVQLMPYGKTIDWCGAQLTALPAGHILGSAMLLIEQNNKRLLYSGDFKLRPGRTCATAAPVKADVLILESTYGKSRCRFRPNQEVAAEFVDAVQRALQAGAVPLVEAYVIGKSQEVTRILTDAGIPVLQHPDVYEVGNVYEKCGVPLGMRKKYIDHWLPGHAIVAPPQFHRQKGMPRLPRTMRFAVTGWAQDEAGRRRLGVDQAFPISDHADYDELFELIERVQPKEIYCTHGPESFVDDLRMAGLIAYRLGKAEQQKLLPM